MGSIMPLSMVDWKVEEAALLGNGLDDCEVDGVTAGKETD